MSTISVKIHDSYRRVVAICDSDLIGRRFEEGKRQLDLRASFYESKKLELEEAVDFIRTQAMEDASFNIVGKESIKASTEAGIITKESVDNIDNIPFTLT